MCGRCEKEPYRGVGALFNGDLQLKSGLEDRADWTVISPKVVVYLGKSAFANNENPLIRGCEQAVNALSLDEQLALNALSKKLGRPAFGL